jgi:hypothetical protein
MQAYGNRKYRATTQPMSITYFKLQDNQTDFQVGVIGSRKIPYIVGFCPSTMNIKCTCPDFEKREYKPLCKHMLFIVNLSNQKNMFNNLTCLDELKDATKIAQIRESIMAIIDQKKLSAELQESNTVSIERDDFCSICMCDLNTQIEKCSVCEHVMHTQCITSWWDLTARWNSLNGKCPYCKDPSGFSHIRQNDEDPWKNFDFSNGSEAVAQQVPEPLLPAAEAVAQQVPELLLPPAEEVDHSIVQSEMINHILSFIMEIRNLNVNDPVILNLDSQLESLQQQHDAIQNAFQAQPE